jgi:GTP 3',8-cyclase
MLTDAFGRDITYLRISVTDRCNYRCRYCVPEAGVEFLPHPMVLRYEQISEIAKSACGLGITKVRLTGGEPLVRRDIETLVRLISAGREFKEICMTTNGSLLTRKKAFALKAAGLGRVNISLDTLDPEIFAALSRGGNLDEVLSGIDAALAAGLTPIKINMVILPETTDDDIEGMRLFCVCNGLELQTIARFSLSDRAPGIATSTATNRPPDCATCNRVRLTSDGYLRPCLFSDKEIKVDFEDIEGSFRSAAQAKPACGTCCTSRSMSQVGG